MSRYIWPGIQDIFDQDHYLSKGNVKIYLTRDPDGMQLTLEQSAAKDQVLWFDYIYSRPFRLSIIQMTEHDILVFNLWISWSSILCLFTSSTTLNLQKFHEDSTIVYSIEEDDHDMLTMTAMIGAAKIIFTQL